MIFRAARVRALQIRGFFGVALSYLEVKTQKPCENRVFLILAARREN
jgi:hypothetical protein